MTAGRGIDHLVLTVNGLDHARDVYERMGFTLSAINHHPFGTKNSIIQLQGNFLELLAVEDPDLMPLGAPGKFNFPRFNFLYLEHHQGLSMLVVETDNAEDAAQDFAEKGIQSYLPFEFKRDAKLPDGSTAEVGFRLAFATEPFAPFAGFFACQQLAPQLFWKEEFQKHANTARVVSEALMIAPEPVDMHLFLEAFTGNRDIHASSMGLEVPTPRGTVRVLSPRAAEAVWGDAIDLDEFETARFAAYTIDVDDLSAAENCLKQGEISHTRQGERLIVPATEGFGAAIAFQQGA